MSWGDIFFGFSGRINRKTHWGAATLVAGAGLSFAALLSYLATDSFLAPVVWERPADKFMLWAPVWLAYFAFLAWPSTALAVKRLHDRGRRGTIWYVYFAASVIQALIPTKETSGAETSETARLVVIPLMLLALYLFFELGVLRGTRGPNAYGDDTLPADYYGGDYSFWSWMLAFEGRISRTKWWLGFFILSGAMLTLAIIMGLAANSFLASHPEFAKNIGNPDWINSAEAAPLIFKLGMWTLLPSLAMGLILWGLVALGVKRLHDRGLSSWLMLVIVVPFFALGFARPIADRFDLGDGVVTLTALLFLASIIWAILEFGILKGETGPNKYGPDPLAG